MNASRLDNLKHFLEANPNWNPKEGPKETTKGVWDSNRKSWNLNYFSDYRYTVIAMARLGKEKLETGNYLLELDSLDQVNAFYKYNSIATVCFTILDLDENRVIHQYDQPSLWGYPNKDNF